MVSQSQPALTTEIFPKVVQRAIQGDLQAVSAIYDHYLPRVYRYMVYRLADPDIAEDLTSEVFLRMVRYLRGYQARGAPFSAWLFKIAHNLTNDHFRRTRFKQEEELEDGLVDHEMNLEQTVDRTLQHEQLYRALCQLNKDQGEVLVLRFIVGLSLSDTAEAMGKSEDAIKGLQRRGLAAVRQVLLELEVSNA